LPAKGSFLVTAEPGIISENQGSEFIPLMRRIESGGVMMNFA
jgi:hypothetical protein